MPSWCYHLKTWCQGAAFSLISRLKPPRIEACGGTPRWTFQKVIHAVRCQNATVLRCSARFLRCSFSTCFNSKGKSYSECMFSLFSLFCFDCLAKKLKTLEVSFYSWLIKTRQSSIGLSAFLSASSRSRASSCRQLVALSPQQPAPQVLLSPFQVFIQVFNKVFIQDIQVFIHFIQVFLLFKKSSLSASSCEPGSSVSTFASSSILPGLAGHRSN